MKKSFLHASCLTAVCGALFSNCSTVSDVSTKLKAKPVALSPFVQHPREMRPQRERAPFALAWVNPALPQMRAHYDSIYVAPVTTHYLRPVKRPPTQQVGVPALVSRPVREIAHYLRASFQDAFARSTDPRLRLTSSPAPGGVTLRLALVELNPTDAAGNGLKGAVPGGAVLGAFTTGNIAIEGQVRDNVTGEVLFEFSDNEKDKMSVASVRDYTPYEHTKVAVADWARQFEELTRTTRGHKVEDSLVFTLNPL